MRLPARFRLKAFPTDNMLWKVDWFGDLLRLGEIGDNGDQFVRINRLRQMNLKT